MTRHLKNQSGISMIELIVALLLALVVATAIYKIFDTNSRLFAGENKVVDMHGNAVNVMRFVSRNARHIGYDPLEAGRDVFGLTSSSFSTSGTATITSNTEIYFTMDTNEDGSLTGNSEYYAMRWLDNTDGTNPNTLQISDTVAYPNVTAWRTIAENVTYMNLVYLYADDTDSDTSGLPNNATTSHRFEDVIGLTITITVQTDSIHNLSGARSYETITASEKFRNNIGS